VYLLPRFYELNVRVNFEENLNVIMDKILIFKELGYYGIGLKVPSNKNKIFNDLKNSVEDKKFKIYSRLDLKGKSVAGLKKSLKNFRLKYDLIGIDPQNLDVCHWAIRDSRPDIIILNEDKTKEFRYTTSKLLSAHEKCVEISLKSLIFMHFKRKSKLLRHLSNKLKFILKSKAFFLITMSPTAGEIYEMRAPRDLMSLLYLLNVPEDIAMKSMSYYAEYIVQKALNKKDPNIVSENIRIIPKNKSE